MDPWWFNCINLLISKKLHICFFIAFSINFESGHNRLTGLKFLGFKISVSFLIGIILAIFRHDGKIPLLITLLISYKIEGNKASFTLSIIFMLILYIPVEKDFFTSLNIFFRSYIFI